jgi:hypothetical protein
MNEVDNAYDAWKAADLAARTAATQLAAAWQQHDWFDAPRPSRDLLKRGKVLQEDANTKLLAAIEAVKRVTGLLA